MEILNVNEKNLDDVIDFIGNTIETKDVDMEIVKNASCVVEDNKIIGVLSYEKFASTGLVRYFIFKETVSLGLVIALLEDVKQKAKDNGILSFLAIVTKEKIKNLLTELGFYEMDASLVYIDEVNILNSSYKNAQILKYVL